MLRIHAAILNGLSFCLVVAGMAAIDNNVRRHVVNIITGNAASELAIVTAPANRFARAALEAVNDYRTDNEYLFGFGVVAAVLFAVLFKA
jgi:hypothetical protein